MRGHRPPFPGVTTAPAAGLYIHVPFCRRKCPYCDFYSLDDRTQIPAYLTALIAEMACHRDIGGPFDTLYFGGGTPSVLTPGQVGRIIDAAGRAFDIPPHAEITLEANPGTVTADTLAGYRSAGINRLNLGVQSFDDDRLRFLGRIHDGAAATGAIRAARRAGFDHLGLDLIYGLPADTPAAWQADLIRAADFRPAHLSCYLLTWEEGTPLYRRWQTGQCHPPPESRSAALFHVTGDVLAGRGYRRYEVSNFARSPSRQSRHNLKYWSLAPYLGLGPSAHSFDPRRWVRRWNHRSLTAYLDDLSAGRPPVAGREGLDRDQRMMEVIYLSLRRAAGIDLSDFEARFGIGFIERFGGVADALAAEGLLRLTPRRCRPTRRGMAYADGMADRFCRLL